MSIQLATKFGPYTDEVFKAESKLSLLTNTDFDWTGAHSVRIWKISTAPMNDYSRNRYGTPGEPTSPSRYGDLYDLSAATEEMLLTKDRSFIFNVDLLDTDETSGQVEAATALSRQLRVVVIPEVDSYVYNKIVSEAGQKADGVALTDQNVYSAILAGSEALDNAEVPDTGRVLIVTPATYTLLKKATEFDNTSVGNELKAKGVVGILDGMAVIKVPANRLPENVGFVIAHPSATCAPVKLEDYNVHMDTPLSSGSIVTGRVVYDAFVLENKANGIYVHPLVGVVEVVKLTITSGATAPGDITIILDDVEHVIALTADDNEPAEVAAKIQAETFTGWTATKADGVVTFTAVKSGQKGAIAFDAGETGVEATIEKTTVGA